MKHTTRHPDRCPLETSYGTGNPTTYCRGRRYPLDGSGWCLDHLIEWGRIDPMDPGERVTYKGRPATVADYPGESYYAAMEDVGGPLILIQIDGHDRRSFVDLNDLVLA